LHTVEESGHLGRAAVSMCQWFPTFQRNVAGADPNKKRNFAFDPVVARADTQIIQKWHTTYFLLDPRQGQNLM
jgi:hypothetical protein